MPKNKKRIVAVLIIMLLFVSVPGTALANGEDQKQLQKEREQVGKVGILESLFGSESGKYYYLDITEKEEEKSSWKKLIPGWAIVEAVEDTMETVMNAIYAVTNWLNNMLFRFNIMITNFMLGVLNFAYEYDKVNRIITHLDGMVQNISGISSDSKFTKGKGLFDGFIGIVTIISVGYAAFLYLWKRSSLESLRTILQTVIALSLALLLFSNYSTFLTNANKLTTEASGLLLTGGSARLTDDNKTNTDLQKEMNKNIKRMFIHRPYLFMQYGTDNEEAIGKKRVNKLLKLKPGKKREKIVQEEVNDKGNQLMTSAYVTDRLVFSFFYLGMNALNSIPIYLLAFLLLILQFWFLGIAVVAPFAFLYAALPGRFGVLRKYMAELFLPLGLKLLVSVGALFVFSVTSILYSLEGEGLGSSVNEYIAIAVVQFVVLIILFILRKRIFGIFSAGSKEMAMLRAEMALLRESMLSPVKSGVQTTATVAGATIGGLSSGGAGIMTGAAIGSSVGKGLTGEARFSEVASQGVKQFQLRKLEKMVPGKEGTDKGNEGKGNQSNTTTSDHQTSENNVKAFGESTANTEEKEAPLNVGTQEESKKPDLVSLKEVMSTDEYNKVMPSAVNESQLEEQTLDEKSNMASLEKSLPKTPGSETDDIPLEKLENPNLSGEEPKPIQENKLNLSRLDQKENGTGGEIKHVQGEQTD